MDFEGTELEREKDPLSAFTGVKKTERGERIKITSGLGLISIV